MRLLNPLFAFTLLCTAVIFSQRKTIPVFVSGTDGYKTYRIPAIIALPNGDLLAFCEGRKNGSSDFGNIDIVMKRSSNSGITWGPMELIVDNDTLQSGNAAPVVDVIDPAYPDGRVFLFYNTGNNSEGEVRRGHGLRDIWYKTSADGGQTWSKGVNITAHVKNSDWRTYANTPGHAIQFHNGKYRGRIFVAANHSAGEPQKNFEDYMSHGYYTDDHGNTFQQGASVNIPGSNEATAAELSDNRLIMNMRNQKGDLHQRIVALSNDGGQTWDTSFFDKHLPDPICEGTILTIGKNEDRYILAFCNAADTSQRNNLTLRISYDEGKTWKKSFLIDRDHESSKSDYTAYSDIVKLGIDEIGILYEKDDYTQIVFTSVRWR